MIEELKSKTKNWDKYSPGKSTEEIAKSYGLEKEQIIRLGSNENPSGCSQKVSQALYNFLKAKNSNIDDLNIYPDAVGQELVKSLKKTFLSKEEAIEISVGNGMDSIIKNIARLILDSDNQSLIINPTFEYYRITSLLAGSQPVFLKTSAQNNFFISAQVVIDELKKNQKIKLVFLCNPNNPTGYFWELEELKKVLDYTREKKVWVFLDEAYTEYVNPGIYQGKEASLISWISSYQNLIIGRTFSKIHGLAALRIGWVALHKNLLSYYQRVQVPFDNNKLGLIAAQTSLIDKNFISKSAEVNKKEREFLIQNLLRLDFKVFPSQSNFVSFLAGPKFSSSAQNFVEKLLKQGLILRDASKFLDAPKDLVRVTVGTPKQNRKLIKTLENQILS